MNSNIGHSEKNLSSLPVADVGKKGFGSKSTSNVKVDISANLGGVSVSLGIGVNLGEIPKEKIQENKENLNLLLDNNKPQEEGFSLVFKLAPKEQAQVENPVKEKALVEYHPVEEKPIDPQQFKKDVEICKSDSRYIDKNNQEGEPLRAAVKNLEQASEKVAKEKEKNPNMPVSNDLKKEMDSATDALHEEVKRFTNPQKEDKNLPNPQVPQEKVAPKEEFKEGVKQESKDVNKNPENKPQVPPSKEFKGVNQNLPVDQPNILKSNNQGPQKEVVGGEVLKKEDLKPGEVHKEGEKDVHPENVQPKDLQQQKPQRQPSVNDIFRQWKPSLSHEEILQQRIDAHPKLPKSEPVHGWGGFNVIKDLKFANLPGVLTALDEKFLPWILQNCKPDPKSPTGVSFLDGKHLSFADVSALNSEKGPGKSLGTKEIIGKSLNANAPPPPAKKPFIPKHLADRKALFLENWKDGFKLSPSGVKFLKIREAAEEKAWRAEQEALRKPKPTEEQIQYAQFAKNFFRNGPFGHVRDDGLPPDLESRAFDPLQLRTDASYKELAGAFLSKSNPQTFRQELLYQLCTDDFKHFSLDQKLTIFQLFLKGQSEVLLNANIREPASCIKNPALDALRVLIQSDTSTTLRFFEGRSIFPEFVLQSSFGAKPNLPTLCRNYSIIPNPFAEAIQSFSFQIPKSEILAMLFAYPNFAVKPEAALSQEDRVAIMAQIVRMGLLDPKERMSAIYFLNTFAETSRDMQFAVLADTCLYSLSELQHLDLMLSMSATAQMLSLVRKMPFGCPSTPPSINGMGCNFNQEHDHDDILIRVERHMSLCLIKELDWIANKVGAFILDSPKKLALLAELVKMIALRDLSGLSKDSAVHIMQILSKIRERLNDTTSSTAFNLKLPCIDYDREAVAQYLDRKSLFKFIHQILERITVREELQELSLPNIAWKEKNSLETARKAVNEIMYQMAYVCNLKKIFFAKSETSEFFKKLDANHFKNPLAYINLVGYGQQYFNVEMFKEELKTIGYKRIEIVVDSEKESKLEDVAERIAAKKVDVLILKQLKDLFLCKDFGRILHLCRDESVSIIALDDLFFALEVPPSQYRSLSDEVTMVIKTLNYF